MTSDHTTLRNTSYTGRTALVPPRRSARLHFPDQAPRPYVGPVLLDEFEARLTLTFAEDYLPPVGHVGEYRPERVLAFIVYQDNVVGVLVFERIRRHCALLSQCLPIMARIPFEPYPTPALPASGGPALSYPCSRQEFHAVNA